MSSRLLQEPIEFTHQLQKQLGCQGITLESGTIEIQTSRAVTFVFCVDLDGSPIGAVSSVIKYSKREHAIPKAKYLKLATPEYYRNFEGDASGVRDDMEGRYQEDIRSFHTKWETLDAVSASMVTGNVTYGTNEFWMFCTSVEPRLTQERRELREEFGANCDTEIQDPSVFARTLGTDLAAHYTWTDVELSPLERILQSYTTALNYSKMVWVYHGKVLYSDNAADIVDSFPALHQPAVIPFIKRQRFANQKEYRFKISTRGRPNNHHFLLPISPELRNLARIKRTDR